MREDRIAAIVTALDQVRTRLLGLFGAENHWKSTDFSYTSHDTELVALQFWNGFSGIAERFPSHFRQETLKPAVTEPNFVLENYR